MQIKTGRETKIRAMINAIQRDVEASAEMTGRRRLDQRVLNAMQQVPRDEFVPDEMKPFAFDNRALAIGQEQTISQPFIVALMTDLLDPAEEHVVLEIGTGSGYQAAVLSQLVKQVCSIEILPDLAAEARQRLERFGYDNVAVRVSDGYRGWVDQAPFDGILVTAAVNHVPQPLVDQLKPGGNLVLPVGEPYAYQELMVVHKDATGRVQTRSVLGVAFVPLTGKRDAGDAAEDSR